MSVVKVQFTRVENEAEVNNTQIKDGQLLYTRDGKLYMDYGTARKKLTSLIELLTVDSTAPSECSLGDMYYNTTTNLIYTAIGTDTWSSTGTTPSTKYLYVDLTNAKLYYYDGVTFTSYGGGSVDADTQMSDTSENPVQNKVIKEYVDTAISSIPEEVIISDTQPSASDNKLWIDTGEVGNQVSEITNSYSESTGLGYSANYLNNALEKNVITLNLTSNQMVAIPSSYGYEKIPLNNIFTQIGDKLTFDSTNNSIIIGAGVHHIEVSGQCSLQNGSNSGADRYLEIKNTTKNKVIGQALFWNQFSTGIMYQLIATPTIAEVSENDVIALELSSYNVETFNVKGSSSPRTILTIRVID